MPENYTKEERKTIDLLMRRFWKKYKETGLSYRQVGALVKAQPATVWRWAHSKSVPSQHHILHIKRFMGYIA